MGRGPILSVLCDGAQILQTVCGLVADQSPTSTTNQGGECVRELDHFTENADNNVLKFIQCRLKQEPSIHQQHVHLLLTNKQVITLLLTSEGRQPTPTRNIGRIC